MVCRGIVKNGVIVPLKELSIPDGTEVRINVSRKAIAAKKRGKPSSRKSGQRNDDDVFNMGDLAVKTGIPDLSINIDHYLYGHPKVKHVSTKKKD